MTPSPNGSTPLGNHVLLALIAALVTAAVFYILGALSTVRITWVNRGPQIVVQAFGIVFSAGWPTRYAVRWWRPWIHYGRSYM
jgi:hypothetical protein